MAETVAAKINKTLEELMETDKKVILFGEDIKDPFGGAYKITKNLSSKFPGRVLNTPISEAAMTGIAAGLSLSGMKPIVEIMYSDFLTLCSDQIVNHIAKFRWMYNDKINTPFVLRTPTGAGKGYGPTHSQALESLFFNIPKINIVSISTFHNIREIYNASINHYEPVIILEPKRLYYKEVITDMDSMKLEINTTTSHFGFNQTTVIKNNLKPEIIMLAYGGMSDICYNEVITNDIYNEIGFELIIPSLISPFDIEPLLKSLITTRKLMIVEETPGNWGWGSEISASVNEKLFGKLLKPVMRLSSLNTPIGCAKHIEEETIPTGRKITESLLRMVD